MRLGTPNQGKASQVRVRAGAANAALAFTTARYDSRDSRGSPVVVDVWGSMAVADSRKCISLLNDSKVLISELIPASSVEPSC